jgi:hypothetical protein
MKSSASLHSILTGALLIATAMSAHAAVPNLAVEASLSTGTTSNLFSDRSAQFCRYRGLSVDLDYSLLSFAQVNFAGEYTYYGQVSNLSNFRYSGGFTLIPTSDSSRVSLLLTGNIRDRQYRDVATDSSGINANEFTGREYDAMLGVGYSLTQSVQLRASLATKSTGYGIDGVLDRETVDAAFGTNITLLNRYSLDLEFGYSTGKFQYIDPEHEPLPGFIVPRSKIDPGTQYDILLEADLKSLYFSPRISTSFGPRVGVSLSYMVRNFQDHDNSRTVYGYSSGWLSPWNNSYDGQAVVLNIKTYLIPRLVVSVNTGYWDRNYLRVAEYETWPSGFRIDEGVNLELARNRTDYRSRTSITVKMPLTHSAGYFLEPSLTIDYTDNKSTVSVYDYTDLSVSGGLTIRF